MSRERISAHKRQALQRQAAERRQILIKIAGGTVALAALGTAGSLVHNSIEQAKQQSEDLNTYYPELTGKKIKDSGKFTTTYSNVRWYNFTELRFNQQSVQAAYDYFDLFVKDPKFIDYGGVEFGSTKHRQNDKILFIVPQDTPSPKWPDVDDQSIAVTQTGFPNGIPSYIKITDIPAQLPHSTNVDELTINSNISIFTEACQASLQMLPTNKQVNNDLIQVAQELLCNSVSRAFTLKQLGYSYEEYLQWANEATVGPSAENAIPVSILNQQQYGQIPTKGFPITNR